MTRRLLAVVLLCVFAAAAHGLLPEAVAAASTAWPVSVGSSGGEAQSLGLPGTPTGVGATCAGTVLNPKAVVSWSAVSLATSYTVYQSTTSSTSGFSAVASGVVGLTWTSGNLGTGSYWYRVAAAIGTNWAGSQSSSSQQISVLLGVSCT
jgi:hypothetical protein